MGRLFFWVMPRRASSASKPLRPPRPPGGEHHPVVGQSRRRRPMHGDRRSEGVDHDLAFTWPVLKDAPGERQSLPLPPTARTSPSTTPATSRTSRGGPHPWTTYGASSAPTMTIGSSGSGISWPRRPTSRTTTTPSPWSTSGPHRISTRGRTSSARAACPASSSRTDPQTSPATAHDPRAVAGRGSSVSLASYGPRLRPPLIPEHPFWLSLSCAAGLGDVRRRPVDVRPGGRRCRSRSRRRRMAGT